MENNKQNNNQKSSVRKKANILMLSGTLLFLIVGITIGGLMFRNSNLNKTNIQTLEKQLLSLKKLKDLQKTNEEKSKKLENQLESEKRALEGKLALKTTTEALNNELTNVKTELTNKDLTKAFNKLFKATPEYTTSFNAYKASEFIKTDEYTDALKAYKVSEFKKSPEYINALTAYKVSQFKKSPEYPEYTKAFNVYKTGKFIKTNAYKGALSVWNKNPKNKQLKTAFIDTKTYKDLLEGHNQNPQLATKFKETPEYTTLLNTYKVSQFKKSPEYTKVLKNWRNSEVKKKNDELEALYKNQPEATKKELSLDQFKNARSDKLPTDQNELNLIFNEELFESKTEYTKALNAFVVNKSEFIKTNGYKTLLDTFKGKKTSDQWKTAFIKTSKYKTPLSAHKVSEHEFIQTKEYKNAFASYLFSFKGKLDALTGALNTQKTDLEGKLEAQKTQLEGKINKKATKTELNDYLKKSKFTTTELKTLLNDVFASKALIELDQTKLTGLKDKLVKALNEKFDTLATKTALNTQKTNLKNQIKTKLTTSELLEAINALTFDNELKTKLTTALKSEFSKYTKSTELTASKLTKLLNNVFASKALNELNEAKLTGLKNELVKVLKDTLATKQELTGKADITALSEYLKQSKFINKLYNVLSKTTKDDANSDEVKAVILKMVEDKLIKNAFDKLVQEFKGLSDISQQTGKELHNSKKGNSFYKLAPFLFESPAKANEKLNELLTGSVQKEDELAIWKVGDTNKWIFGKLNELKALETNGAKTYKKLQKVVYLGNTWNTQANDDKWERPAPVVETTPQGSGSGGTPTTGNKG